MGSTVMSASCREESTVSFYRPLGTRRARSEFFALGQRNTPSPKTSNNKIIRTMPSMAKKIT